MQIENAYIAKIVEGIQQALPPQNEYDKGYCDALQSFVISLSQAKGSFLNLQLIEDSVKTALDAHLNNAPELEMEEAVAKGADDHIGVKITSMSVEKFLQVLANFSREACASMNDGNGIRSGLYVRRVDDALKIRRIAPMELDDVDLLSGVVYPAANLEASIDAHLSNAPELDGEVSVPERTNHIGVEIKSMSGEKFQW